LLQRRSIIRTGPTTVAPRSGNRGLLPEMRPTLRLLVATSVLLYACSNQSSADSIARGWIHRVIPRSAARSNLEQSSTLVSRQFTAEFDSPQGWRQYRAWVRTRLVPHFELRAAGRTGLTFARVEPGDVYQLQIRALSGGTGSRVRVTVVATAY
jgi:hypothetical protein